MVPSAYKHFINPLLDCISEHRLGLQIGSVYCGVVGVADGLLFMSQSRESLHCQLYLQHSYANRERYKVSETKTKTMHFNAKKINQKRTSLLMEKLWKMCKDINTLVLLGSVTVN